MKTFGNYCLLSFFLALHQHQEVAAFTSSDVLLLYDTGLVDTSTSGGGEAYHISNSITAMGLTVRQETTFASWIASLDSGSYNAAVVPELERGSPNPDAGQRTIIRNFVANGGRLLFSSDSGSRDTTFINSVFGGDGVTLGSGSGGPYAEDAVARAASVWSDNTHLSLPASNGNYAILVTAAPAGTQIAYGTASGAGALQIPIGSGLVIGLAFDWFETPEPPEWTEALGNAFSRIGTPGNTVGAHGDPYFKDWSGQMWDFMGQCDLMFLSQPKFRHVGLDIHIRTKIKQNYSYISATAVRLGNDILEVYSYGVAFLNGEQLVLEELNKEPKTMSKNKFPITYSNRRKDVHELMIDISPDRRGRRQIIVRTIGEFGGVRIKKGRRPDFGGSVGLLGQFGTGNHLARDGVTVLDDPNEFGQEWQVRSDEPKLFMDKFHAPQHPESKCILPEEPLVVHRRLGETTGLEKEAKQACAHVLGAEERDICVLDVVRTGNRDLAEFYGED